MKNEYKIILEVATAGLGLYGLTKRGVIGVESAVLAGIILISLIFCFQSLRQELKDDIQEVKKEISPIKHALAEIQKYLTENFSFSPLHKVSLANKYGQEHSPIKPNEEGRRLLSESSFNGLYPKIKDRVFKLLDEMGTRTLYDAEENARTALSQLSSDPLFDDVKHYAVNHHQEPLDIIFMVASWIIRDDYAQKNNITK